jgi:hypothetical protein
MIYLPDYHIENPMGVVLNFEGKHIWESELGAKAQDRRRRGLNFAAQSIE